MAEVYLGDIGTEIVIDCGIDLTQSTAVTIVALRPDGTKVDWSSAVYQSTFVRYVTQAGDLSIPGLWQLQPKIESPTWSGSGSVVEMTVMPVIT